MKKNIKFNLVLIIILFSSVSGIKAENSDIYFRNGLNAYYINNLEDALINFTETVKLQPNNPKYRFYLGKTLFKLEKFNEAIQEFETVLKLDNNFNEAIKFLADSYFNVEDYENAIKMYGILSQKYPNDFEIHFKLGQSYFVEKINNLSKALEHFNNALTLVPRNALVHYYIGRIYLRQNNFPEAINKFDKAIELDPSNGMFYYWRGNAYYAQMDFFNSKDEQWQSIINFRKAMELGFDQAQTYFMFANTCLNRGMYYMNNQRKEEGIELLKTSIIYYKKVIIIKIDASNAFNNLGLAYLGLNKLQDAIKAFKKAIELEPTIAFFHNNLGDAYFRMGNYRDAINEWELVLELEPDPNNIKGSLFSDNRDVRQKIRDAEQRL